MKSFSKQTLSSKAAIIALLILAAFLGQLKFKQWQNGRQIEKEKQSLKEQANELQKKNDELTQSLQYLNSPSFKERVAREQLGLKKEGEQVYTFGSLPQNQGMPQEEAEKASGNFSKWWDYFFKN